MAGQINQDAFRPDINPADRNNMAIQAGYTGWGDYLNNQNSGGGGQASSSNISGGSSSGNWQDIVKQSIDMYKQANAPAVAQLQSQIPQIQSSYAAQTANVTAKTQTLKDRYDNLLKTIQSSKTKDVNAQTVVTQNEMGKRGILPSSTLAQQELINTTSPITDKYTGYQTTAALDQTAGQQEMQDLLNQLTSGEVKDTSAVNNAIAQLQSGAATSGIQTGTSMYGQEQTNAANAALRKYTEQQDATKNQIAQQQLANQTAQTQYDTSKPYYNPNTGSDDVGLNNGGETDTGTSIKWLNSQGKAWTDNSKVPTVQFKGKNGKTYQEYSDGTWGSTLWTQQ